MIIALAGKAGSGKSTIAKFLHHDLQDTYGIKNEVASFATPIKDMAKALTDYIDEEIPDKNDEFLNSGRSYRYVLQTLGTEWGRNLICNSFWTDILDKRIASKNCHIIIDDLRFKNELEWLKSKNDNFAIYVKRNVDDLERRDKSLFEVLHESENNINSKMCDITVANNGSLSLASDFIQNFISEKVNLNELFSV